MKSKLFFSVAVFTLILATPTLIRAEWFSDIYLGAAITDGSEVKLESNFPEESASEKTSYDTSFAFGGRIGYYPDFFHYLGVAGDMSYFQAESEKVDFSACIDELNEAAVEKKSESASYETGLRAENPYSTRLSMIRTSGSYSWWILLLGYPVLGVWYWCSDQTIVQRVLGARRSSAKPACLPPWIRRRAGPST